jgi:hypothetical protein
MQSDRDHLKVDLGFLDEAKPHEVRTQTASKYRVNWLNIAIIGGLIIVFLIWIASNVNTSNRRSAPSTYAPLAADTVGTVNNGQFGCSRYDSNQVDLMAPKNEFALNQEEEELKRRGDVLDSLKAQIDTSGITQYSDQASIDRYYAMVAQYNAQLGSLRADYSSHQARIETYNQQVQARNNYLLTHCRSSR